jgi:hypothetical protein
MAAMTDNYRVYEAECERLRAENGELLAGFETWLTDQGLSPETASRHRRNVDLYINHYLLYEGIIEPPQGCWHVGMVLGYWLPRKVSSSEYATRSFAAGLLKFYRFLAECALVSAETVKELQERLRAGMPDWLHDARRFR